MPQPADIWKYLTTDPNGIAILAGIVGAVLGAIAVTLVQVLTGIPAAILRFIKRALFRRSSRLSEEAQVFEAITNPATLLPKLYSEENNSDLLAHHRIGYQTRDPERDTRAQLRAALNLKRYLLITAPTGFGKTREAATLAQSLMNEGWRVVRVRAGWLDKPNDLPPALRDDRRRIIILLDDLNGMFSRGDYVQAPQRDQSAALAQSSYHDRLRDALDAFERMCTPNEIRVIATARDEADQWLPLHYDERDDLWKRFTRVELPAPRDSAIAALLDEEVSRANLPAERTEFAAIARKNDRTYTNAVLNLQRAEKEGNSLNLATYAATLDGSWREVYERALRQHPAVRYLYDAMDVLRQAGIELYEWMVEPTALLLWNGNTFQRLGRRANIDNTLRYLVSAEKILALSAGKLTPRDGQIEAKGTREEWQPYAQQLLDLVLRLAARRRGALLNSLGGFGAVLLDAKQYERALTLAKKGTELAPQNASFYNNLGILLRKMERYAEAEQAYRDAIARDPNLAAAYSNLGLLLYEKLNRPAEAEHAYHDAIDRDPNLAQAHYNLGNLLSDLNRPAEAEQAYRDALAREPNLAQAYSNLGNLLAALNRPVEAEQAYRDAIARAPNYATAYYNLGNLLAALNRPVEAEQAYRDAIAHDPNDAAAYFNLGILLLKMERYAEAEQVYRTGLTINPNNTAILNKIIISLRLQGRERDALPLFEKLASLVPKDYVIRMTIARLHKELGDASASVTSAAEARALIPAAEWYALACLESICGNVDAALAHLRRAAAQPKFNRAWAWRDPDLQWIRDDPRFAEIVGHP